MSGERVVVRCALTTMFVIIGIVLALPVAVMKALEGLLLAYQITTECVRQVWAAKGIPEFDRFTR